ncbi:hypothetical protein D3C75_802670 [compost metagenome]
MLLLLIVAFQPNHSLKALEAFASSPSDFPLPPEQAVSPDISITIARPATPLLFHCRRFTLVSPS